MHIAICDDNVADRKQLERLLKRESDRRAASTGILYADSFGNASALLANPMQYDVFYIDMCHTPEVSGLSVAVSLRRMGVHAPIFMCCSDVNYRSQDFPEDILYLDKPMQLEELCKSLDMAEQLLAEATPVIELREEENTLYVTEPDILYGVEAGRYLIVTLTDGRQVKVSGSALNFFAQVEQFESFIAPTNHCVINIRHIASFHFMKVTMADGKPFTAHGAVMKYARRIYKKLQSE